MGIRLSATSGILGTGHDGQVTINGVQYLIQAKRHTSDINRAHVDKLAAICQGRGVSGIFVHTGKTGKASWREAGKGWVVIMSGGVLLQLLTVKDS